METKECPERLVAANEPRNFNEYFCRQYSLDEVMLKFEGWPREIYSLNEEIKALRSALKRLVDAVKEEPAMNNKKYDSIGIQVNSALAMRNDNE